MCSNKTPVLLEHIFCLFKQVAEDVFVVLFGLFAFQASKLLEQAFLLRGQVGGRYHFHDNVLVAASVAMHNRHTHTLETERAIALRACWNLEHCRLAIDSRHLNFVAKRCLRKANRQFVEDIVALAFEERMRLDRKNHIQISRRPTASAYLALACHAHIDAVIHAGRNIDHHAAIVAHASLPATLLTRRRNHAPLAVAAFAHRHVDKLPKDRLLYAANLARALAGGTASRGSARLRATAATY